MATQAIEITDQFTAVDFTWHRDALASHYLKGSGVEIGALHKPTKLTPGVSVQYVDYKTQAQNIAQYPELKNEQIVETNIVDDGFILSKIAAESQNFIIANHVLEHSPDPIGTLKIWLSKIRVGGYLFFTVPISERCFDRGRPITSLEHLIADHELFLNQNVDEIINVTRGHIEEFMEISGANIRQEAGLPPSSDEEKQRFMTWLMTNFQQQMQDANAYHKLFEAHVQFINFRYDVHYHTFSPTSFWSLLDYFSKANNCTLETTVKSGGGESIGILRKQAIN